MWAKLVTWNREYLVQLNHLCDLDQSLPPSSQWWTSSHGWTWWHEMAEALSMIALPWSSSPVPTWSHGGNIWRCWVTLKELDSINLGSDISGQTRLSTKVFDDLVPGPELKELGSIQPQIWHLWQSKAHYYRPLGNLDPGRRAYPQTSQLILSRSLSSKAQSWSRANRSRCLRSLRFGSPSLSQLNLKEPD